MLVVLWLVSRNNLGKEFYSLRPWDVKLYSTYTRYVLRYMY